MRAPLLFMLLFVLATWGCAHSYSYPTGLPADVHDRFFFHISTEARDRGFGVTPGQESVSVRAPEGTLSYRISGDEITVGITIPNRSGATKNYYREKRIALKALSDELVEGARARAREAKDFAY